MKNLKKVGLIGTAMAVILAVGITAYAATIQSPSEIAADVTGMGIDEVVAQRSEGKTYGEIANELGKLDEFKSLILEQKKAILNEKVAEGTLSQEESDEIYSKLAEAQENCDGTGGSRIGKEYGVSFGMGSGKGNGSGEGNGQKNGMGKGCGKSQGTGMGTRDGNCIVE